VFCDIEPDTFTLDPAKVEELITPWTTAILAVHVFGRPCRMNELADIAKRHNLALIYDAAHAFGVRVNGRPIGHYGDLSMFSFHATKLYHSIEGGMLAFKDSGLSSTFKYLKNFGFKNETEVVMPGTNAKMNEMQALMGSMVLGHISDLIEKRKQITFRYKEKLKEVCGIRFAPEFSQDVHYNHAYMPVEVDEIEFGMSRDQLYETLKKYNVFTRRYFYPLVCDFACYKSVYVKGELPVARQVADQILTLPIYHNLSLDVVDKICDIIISIRSEETDHSSLRPAEKVKH
jgi:dTDP-4-amino-4,6-dideoxygalactose transaminase